MTESTLALYALILLAACLLLALRIPTFQLHQAAAFILGKPRSFGALHVVAVLFARDSMITCKNVARTLRTRGSSNFAASRPALPATRPERENKGIHSVLNRSVAALQLGTTRTKPIAISDPVRW